MNITRAADARTHAVSPLLIVTLVPPHPKEPRAGDEIYVRRLLRSRPRTVDPFFMKRMVSVLLLSAIIGAAGCSVNQATSNVATMDAAAKKACSELSQLRQDRASLSPRDLRDRVGQIYADASASPNPVIKARAVALYTDAAYAAEGAGPQPSFQDDVAAMRQACG